MIKHYQKPYLEGFCKTAEAYGVDPQELMKVAEDLIPYKKVPIWGKLYDEEIPGIFKSKTAKNISRGATADVIRKIVRNSYNKSHPNQI